MQRRRRRDFRDFHGSPCCRDTKVVGSLNFPRKKKEEKKKRGERKGKKRERRKKVKERKKRKKAWEN